MHKITTLAMFRRAALALAICLTATGAAAQGSNEDAVSSSPALVGSVPGKVIRVATARTDVTLPVFWMAHEGATVTVMLMPGGGGGFGHYSDGQLDSGNFLVRTRGYFYGQGFNVAVVGRASDQESLGYAYRAGAEHVGDLKKVVEALKQLSPQPVWMIGTSRGTVSTTAAAIAFGNEQLAGIVLTSSVTNRKKQGAVPSQNLSAIRIPVLVMHHENDACPVCRPYEAKSIVSGLDNSPFKKLIMETGGGNPTGNPCAGQHFHGFIGMEKEAVEHIATWIKKPTN